MRAHEVTCVVVGESDHLVEQLHGAICCDLRDQSAAAPGCHHHPDRRPATITVPPPFLPTTCATSTPHVIDIYLCPPPPRRGATQAPTEEEEDPTGPPSPNHHPHPHHHNVQTPNSTSTSSWPIQGPASSAASSPARAGDRRSECPQGASVGAEEVVVVWWKGDTAQPPPPQPPGKQSTCGMMMGMAATDAEPDGNSKGDEDDGTGTSSGSAAATTINTGTIMTTGAVGVGGGTRREAVVVLLLVRCPKGIPAENVITDLRRVYGSDAAMKANRNLLMVDCGIPSAGHRKGAPLEMAFRLCAYKFVQWKPDSKTAFVQQLVSLIIESAKAQCCDQMEMEYISPGKVGTALDITEMAPPAVDSLLQFLSLTPDEMEKSTSEGNVAGLTEAAALRRWIQVKNWPAVRELVGLAQTLREQDVNLSDLELNTIPEQLVGISCRILELSDNPIRYLPPWFFRCKIQTVVLSDNCPLLEYVPAHLKKRWQALKHYLLFGEEPVLPRGSKLHKLVLIGEPGAEKSAFLKCLMEKKKGIKSIKRKSSQQFTQSTPVISVHKPFKLSKTSVTTWTAWELRTEHPLYPCFFCSYSIFLLFFDFDKFFGLKGEESNVHFWLNELSTCQRLTNRYENAEVILIGFSVHKGRHDSKAIYDNLLHPCVISHLGGNISFRGCMILNLRKAEGHFIEYPYTTYTVGLTSLEPIKEISQLLDRLVDDQNAPISSRWVHFSTRLSHVKEPVISWSKFVALARGSGVGIQQTLNSDVDIQMCCDYLSDTGAIIHFKHEYWSCSNGNLSQLVVLKPEWFNEIMNVVTNSVKRHVDFLERSQQYGVDRTATFLREVPGYPILLSLLSYLDMVLLHDQIPQLSISMFRCNYSLDALWSSSAVSDNQAIANCIRTIEFGSLHNKMLPQLMNMLCQVPGVEPKLSGKTGVWFSKSCKEGISEDLYLRSTSNKDTSIDLFMKLTWENHDIDPLPSYSRNLGVLCIMWLNDFCRANNLPNLEQTFSCATCLRKRLESKNTILPCEFHSFKESEVLEVVQNGKEDLICSVGGNDPLYLADTAPEFSLLVCEDKIKTSTHETCQLIAKGSGVSTALPKVLPVLSVLRGIPQHLNVVKYTGACIGKEGHLFSVTESFPLRIPPQLEALGLKNHNSLNLRDLMELCMQRENEPRTPKTSLDCLFPMSLREKLLKDVARGLHHLHAELPFVVHGDLVEDGNVLISSLEETGTGPWAKIAHLGVSRPEKPYQSGPWYHKGQGLSSQHNLKSDLRNFGILVHKVVSMTQHPVHFHPTCSPPTISPAATPLQPAAHPPALSSVPPIQQRTDTSSHETTITTTNHTAAEVGIPVWAQQVIECCSPSPTSQSPPPSFQHLLHIWGHY
ncbi:hypothetical protein Pelo_4014 [Pelomyxa schiedti]|nr:hypothetical protein Pelo_4014 [Pelomyxa schiedti]